MTLEANVLREDAIRQISSGYEVDVHIAWYRSLPLSCVEDIALTVGDKTYSKEQVEVVVEGNPIKLSDLASMTDKWWFVQDALTVLLKDDNPVSKGDTTRLSVSLATRIPYIIIGPNFPLVQRTDVTKEVTVQ